MVIVCTILLSNLPASQPAQLKDRSQIDPQYQWKTEDIFPDDESWEKEFDNLKKRLNELTPYQGKLAESAQTLRQCLHTRDALNISLEKLSLYANLKFDQDTRVPTYQAYRDQISALTVQFNQKKSYIEPEILSIPYKKN